MGAAPNKPNSLEAMYSGLEFETLHCRPFFMVRVWVRYDK